MRPERTWWLEEGMEPAVALKGAGRGRGQEFGVYSVWLGGMGHLSLTSGTWLLCGVQIMGKRGLGKAVRKTCS